MINASHRYLHVVLQQTYGSCRQFLLALRRVLQNGQSYGRTPLQWLTRSRTNITKQAGRVGITVLGVIFLASLGLSFVVVLITISLMDFIDYLNHHKRE